MRKNKYINEDEINSTVVLYEAQYKAAIFEKLKENYLRISKFKATLAIKSMNKVITSWRNYAENKA